MAQANAAKSGSFKVGGDIKINRLGFGAMRITGEGIWGPPKDRAEAIRTANSYGPDVSEQLIREALHPYKGMLIATKAGFRRSGPGVWEMDGGPDYLRQEAVRSCKKRRRADRTVAAASNRFEGAAQRAVRCREIVAERRNYSSRWTERSVDNRHRGRGEGLSGGDGAEPLNKPGQ